MEILEPRQLFSAVTVEDVGFGFYEVKGTPGNDQVNVTIELVNDVPTATITDQTGALWVIPDVAYVAVDTGEGNDTVIANVADDTFCGVGITLGDGDNPAGNPAEKNIAELTGCGVVLGGPGPDEINGIDTFRGEFYGRRGKDEILVQGNSPDIVVDGGDGDDHIDFTMLTAPGTFYGGNGNDVFVGKNGVYQGYFQIDGGAGTDTYFSSEKGSISGILFSRVEIKNAYYV